MKKILNHLREDWYKYTLELIVITAGILGAYALNNWNEGFKDRKVELKFYREMVADLEFNLMEMEGVDRDLKQNIEDIEQIDHYFKTDKPIDDSLKICLARFQSIGIVNIANSAYQFMQNNGLSFVKNDTLRVWITNMYERHFYNVKHRNDMHENRLKGKIEPFMSKHFRYSDDQQFTPMLNTVSSLNIPIDYDRIRANIEFINLYMGLKSFAQVRRFWLAEAIERCKGLISAIEKEIKRLEK